MELGLLGFCWGVGTLVRTAEVDRKKREARHWDIVAVAKTFVMGKP